MLFRQLNMQLDKYEYSYEVLKNNGNIIKNKFKGTEVEFNRHIKSQNAYLIGYKIKRHRKKHKKILNDKYMYIICKNLYVQIRSGLNIKNAFDNMSKMNSNKKIKNVFEKVYSSIIKGNNIKDSMENHNFPKEFVSMIGAGEISGTMEEVLKKLTEFYMYKWKTKKNIKNKITYPLMILIMFNIMVFVVFSIILPKFNNISGYKIDKNIEFIFNISDFINNNIIIALIVNIMAYYFIYKLLMKMKFNNIPILKKFIKKYYYLNFFTTFEILQNAGIKYDDILLICSENMQDIDLKEAAKNIRLSILKGYDLTESFINSNEFPKDITDILYNGENSGDLSGSLDLINEIYKEEFLDGLDRIIKFIEPLIILLIAVMVGTFLINIMVPIMNSFYNM